MRHLRWVGRESVQKHVLVARLGEKNGRDEFAIAQYRRSIELFPSVDAWDGLGAVYMHQGRFELALDAYEHAIALKPDSPRLWFRRAQLELALARRGTSPEPDMLPTISALRRVLELEPAHAPASLLLARLVATAGRRDEAVKILETAIEHAGDAPSAKLRQRLAELQQTGS
jgi:cytochrome c-type biogenesis protein CcmH/NrfG